MAKLSQTEKRALVVKYAARLEDTQNHHLMTQDIITWLAMCDTEEEMIRHCERNAELLARRIAETPVKKVRKSRKDA